MDLNMMMREQASAGLQRELADAVTNGDVEAANKATAKIAALAVQTAPKAPAFGDPEIRAELDKQTWFGTDPKRSAKAVEFGKTMDPKKFATAAAFAEAIVKAVDEEFKLAGAAAAAGGGDADDEDADDEDDTTAAAAAPAAKRKTDGPSDADTGARTVRRTAGPWTKLTDAPADIQKEIKRSADKLVSASAPKEQREKFISGALESHYLIAQRKAGKK